MRRTHISPQLKIIYHPMMHTCCALLYALFLTQFAIRVNAFHTPELPLHAHSLTTLRSTLTPSPSDAVTTFNGDYPSGAQFEFAEALKFLLPLTPEHEVTLSEMEATFKHLDAELVRQSCSEPAEEVIDELWRTIKLMYNGSSRLSALASRQTKKAKRSPSRLRMYASVLSFLNPSSPSSKTCNLNDLKTSKAALQNFIESDDAKIQVVVQLDKAIRGVEEGGLEVNDSIVKAWEERESLARERLA
ncbi:hypothetical protein TL16_g08057 [Triparma laevis f. inornata]|uniref:Uncharacterized protein n=1 Tax=Triparma laevis f. inornata TaxID=1714386 RepID=A0A9W7EHJ6_9STRA|nr:hypothetical protein TL16_g08057 [Triparma laevis f. inornata]